MCVRVVFIFINILFAAGVGEKSRRQAGGLKMVRRMRTMVIHEGLTESGGQKS